VDTLYTVEETMSKLKISRAGLYRLISNGKLKSVKLGGRTLIKESDLSRFIDSLGPEDKE
jgi:excisionase family DNA binding protein